MLDLLKVGLVREAGTGPARRGRRRILYLLTEKGLIQGPSYEPNGNRPKPTPSVWDGSGVSIIRFAALMLAAGRPLTRSEIHTAGIHDAMLPSLLQDGLNLGILVAHSSANHTGRTYMLSALGEEIAHERLVRVCTNEGLLSRSGVKAYLVVAPPEASSGQLPKQLRQLPGVAVLDLTGPADH